MLAPRVFAFRVQQQYLTKIINYREAKEGEEEEKNYLFNSISILTKVTYKWNKVDENNNYTASQATGEAEDSEIKLYSLI